MAMNFNGLRAGASTPVCTHFCRKENVKYDKVVLTDHESWVTLIPTIGNTVTNQNRFGTRRRKEAGFFKGLSFRSSAARRQVGRCESRSAFWVCENRMIGRYAHADDEGLPD